MSIQRWRWHGGHAELKASEHPDGEWVGYADHLAALEEAQVTGFRDGYNAHAASRAKSEAMFGPYTNQHGEGENP